MGRPPMDRDVARVESAIEAAARRGDFDDLPGAGKPWTCRTPMTPTGG